MSHLSDEMAMALEADVDVRLAGLWSVVWRNGLDEEASPEQLGVLVRAAYQIGYRDRGAEDGMAGLGELERGVGIRFT